MCCSYSTMFKCEIKNRFALAQVGPLGLADSEGGFNQRRIDYYTERAKGGTGLIITGVTFVDNEVEDHGMPNVPCPTHNPVQFVRTENGIERFEYDSVILSVGYKEEDSLYKELEFEVSEINLLGDARKVSNIMYAIWDAYEVANHI